MSRESAYVRETGSDCYDDKRPHHSVFFCARTARAVLELLMSIDVPATPVEIVKVGHPALRNGTRNVPPELFGTAVLHELIEVMRATLAGQGVGLAAPQIAVPLRLFVIEDTLERMAHLTPEQQKARNRYPFPFEAVINPTWYATSPETVIETEGCLSIPGFKADVCRYWAIEVEGFQPNGQRKTWSVEGWPARIFQHEIDHLEGRLLTDCMLPRTLTSTGPHGTGASSDLLEHLSTLYNG
jgi:peptide deformylase